MRRAAMGLLALIPLNAQAQARLKTTGTVSACVDLTASAALNDADDPRRNDPRWVDMVRRGGDCFTVTSDQRWEELSSQGNFSLLRKVPPQPGEPPLFFRSMDLEPANPPVPSPQPPPATSPPPVISQSSPAQPDASSSTNSDQSATSNDAGASVDVPQPSQATAPDTTTSEDPSTVAAAVAAAGDASSTDATSESDDHALLVFFIIAILAIGILVGRDRRKKREQARRAQKIAQRLTSARDLIFAEIDAQQQRLHVRRLQLAVPDFYGTVSLVRWEQEIKAFCVSRLIPTLERHGLEDQWPLLSFEAEGRVEGVAVAIQSVRQPDTFVSDPQMFDPRMDPVDYERHCALLLREVGWDAHVTVASGDQGTDVIARRFGKTLVLQCKLYSQPVGNGAVQEISAARLHQRADFAAVVSNALFTNSARQLAHTNGVYLMHHSDLPSFDPFTSELS